jgi:hypothetical protein
VKEGAPLAGIELTQPLTQHRRRKMALETELRYFGEHKEEWLKHYEGKYALVKGETLVGTFTTFQEAYQRGIAEFGKEPFLVQQVVREEPVAKIPSLYAWLG